MINIYIRITYDMYIVIILKFTEVITNLSMNLTLRYMFCFQYII